MKKILLAGVATITLCSASAFAADMARQPVYKAAPVAPTFSWTGCYVGGNIGWGRAKATASGTVGVTAFSHTDHASGVVGGGQLGCDYQAGNVVFGIEGMFDGADIKKTVIDPSGIIVKSKLNSFETLTGRIGWAMDRSLLYVKGGAAWEQTKQDLNATAVGGVVDNVSKDFNGWDLGVGWEYAFAPNWSAKIEYNYMHFRNSSILFPNNATTVQVTNNTLQTIMVGLNYRFDWGKGPVSARY
jgi:outer membrane immunogenic protein